MASVNKWIGIGNLGRDPETRYTSSGEAICNFSIACTENWKDKQTGEKREMTEWVRISAFGKLAEICGQYLKKGSQVYVEGSLRTRKWTDKDVQVHCSADLRDVHTYPPGRCSGMSAPASSGGGGGYDDQADYAPAPPKNRPKPSFDDLGDDIPF